MLTALREGRELPQVPICPAAGVGPRPLSYAQQRLWFLDQFEPEGRAAFNLPSPVRLRGALNAAALTQALSEIVRRHEALRTTFPTVGGEPAQSVAPRLTLNVPVFDLCGLDETSREREATRLAAEEARRPFDLAEGPLLRAALVRLGPEEHRLLLTMHHIISDGWSVSVFARELAALYKAYAAGTPSPLADLPIQYADYSSWQREWLRGEVLDSQLDYWKRHLAAAPPATELPLDHPRPRARTYRGANTSLTLPEELARLIRELSRAEGGTLYMTLLAAFKVLLSRYTGRADVLVGSPVANRHRSETEDLIGFFVNTLVLRTEVSGELSFRELLGRVRETTLTAFAHQDLPFERLIEEVQPERHLSHTPFFQVFFNMLNLPATSFRLAGLELAVMPPPEASAKFDLTLYVTDEGAGLRLDLVYNADLFGRPRMAELLRQLAHLLGQAVADPSASVAQYSLLTPAAAALLPDPTETLDLTWEGAVHALFRERARETPEKLAVVSHEEAWSYRELDARSDRLARELLDAGVRPREVVAIYAHRSAALVWGILGVMKAGAAFVILDSAYPAAHLVECLRMANPRGWLRQSAAGPLPHALAEFVREQPFRCRVELRPRAEDEAEHDRRVGAEVDGEGGAEVPTVKVGPDDLAYVAFTSGSTGRPKGILGRHGPLTHFLPWQREAFGLCAEDRYSMLSGLSHDPLQRDIFTPLSLGATVCIPDPERLAEPGWLAAWARETEVSIANLTPAMMQLLTQTADGDLRLTALRHAFVVGDVLTQREVSRLYELAPSVACVNLYGATETQRAIAYLRVPREADGPDAEMPGKRAVPLGRGARDVQLLVLNAAGKMAGVGELGELYVRSPHLAAGYLGGEELTRVRFLTNPFTGAAEDRTYKTGDLGRYLPDGNVEFAGRNDFQVKLRGFRIELGEVESALERHPAVFKAVVLAGEDGAGDKFMAAYLVARERPGPGPGELRRFLQDRLPTYMVPAVFITLDELPVTPNGKVDRRALPAPSEVGRDAATGPVAPRTHVEEVLANIWAGLLNVAQAGADDNFFELGGHSLLATQAVGRIREAFGVEISLRALFERPTPAGLRARFVAVDGRPIQFVSEPAPLRLPVVDLSGLPPAVREEKVKALVEAEAHRPFDLSAGPLLRATSLRLGAQEHAVLFSVHHIVSDGWSLGVLTGEVGALYTAFDAGRPSPLAELSVQYVDYAAWQRETLRGEVLDAHAAYWRRQLAEPLPAVKLGADRERPAAPTFRGETRTAVLPEALRDSLKTLSLQESVTLFVTLMAAFKALLRYYGRQDDVVVGTDVANRTRVEAEGLIGFFVNQLVLRTDLSGNPTFRELLAREHEVVLDAHTYQDLPFDRLVGLLNPERELHRTPLFQAKLVLQNTPAATLELPGLVAAPLRAERRHAKFDLLLNLWDTEGGLVAALEYNTDIFDAQTAARLLRHYELLLRQAASQPAARLDELNAALEDAERERQSRRARELEEANVRRLRQLARKPLAATTERRNLP
ncbi:MAG: amino acid adenylation domain-containing protein [Acidobacteria bacterium]|nr:amino acid adenylation domain-containing protein [Acidobacteriota bacterium]